MIVEHLPTLTGIIVGLQFAAFGWRVHREINVGEEERRTWLPLPDILNVLALLSVVGSGIVAPLATGSYGPWSQSVLAGGATAIAFHPLTMAAHYGIPWRKSRPTKLVCKDKHDHTRECHDYCYAPPEERITLAVSLVAIASAMLWVSSQARV